MPRHRRTEKGVRARRAILEAAEPLLAERGFYGTSVRDLAGAVGVPTASLLHHFPSKAKIYAAVLAAIADDLEAELEPALDGDTTGDFGERLRRLIDHYLEWTAANPARATLLVRELLDNPRRLGDSTRMALAPVVDSVSRFVRAGQRAGAFPAIHPLVFLTHLIGAPSYFSIARPTLERLAPASQRAGLARRFRRESAELIARTLLVPQ